MEAPKPRRVLSLTFIREALLRLTGKIGSRTEEERTLRGAAVQDLPESAVEAKETIKTLPCSWPFKSKRDRLSTGRG